VHWRFELNVSLALISTLIAASASMAAADDSIILTTSVPTAGAKKPLVPGISSCGPANLSKTKKVNKDRYPGNAPCLTWIDPDVKPHAVLLCVHGLGLHNGSYEDFGKRMAPLGIATYSIDVRGFGSWMKAQGREKVNFAACLTDVKNTLNAIHRANPGLPVFVLGESMGGAIALRATALYPDLVQGLISSVPAGDRFKQNKTRFAVAINALKGFDRPFDVGKGVINQATQDPELRESWEKDPLARLNLSPRELLQFQGFMNQNHDSAKNICSTPVLIVQGCKDKLVRPEGTVELYNELTTKDRELALIPNSEHLIFEENQFNDQVIELVRTWIDTRISKAQVISSDDTAGKH
jgi:acylglycerol lipase